MTRWDTFESLANILIFQLTVDGANTGSGAIAESTWMEKEVRFALGHALTQFQIMVVMIVRETLFKLKNAILQVRRSFVERKMP